MALNRFSASNKELKINKIPIYMFPQKLREDFNPNRTKAIRDILSEIDGVEIHCDGAENLISFDYEVLVNNL